MELIIGISGASGVIYGIKLLKHLSAEQNCKINLIISDHAKQLIEYETNENIDDLIKLSDHYYENSALESSIASGSKLIEGMVIVPCSMSTLAKINSGITDNLITRAADVSLKEQRKLIVVPRETPCNSIHLRNLAELSTAGVIILPGMPGFYHLPQSIDDLINFITGKILDQLGIDHELFTRWSDDKIPK
jgi:4-hydroxy-3-polyprenylbenzoate decarboxylase